MELSCHKLRCPCDISILRIFGVMMATSENRNDEPSSKERGDEDAISRNLKRVFNEVANEPLPDKLSSLLEQLRKNEKSE